MTGIKKQKCDSGTRYHCHTICIVLIGLLILTGMAGAEGGITERGLTLRRVVPPRTRGLPYLGDTDAVTCERVEWTLNSQAAATGVKFMYSIGILDGTNPDEDGVQVADTLYQSQIVPETTFGYTFYEEGAYVLFVDPCDKNGNFGDTMFYRVNVGKGTGANPLKAKVSETAEDCRRDSDFATALAINNWLCEYVSYDDDLIYFSPEGALLFGKGVCNAYTRAFQLIARECGLQCCRVCGMAGTDWHTWNAVRMDGNWYHVDVTWNDNGMKPVYYWFGITDALLAEDHTLMYYAQGDSCECNRMECNYYVHENKVETYTISVPNGDPSWQSYPQMIQNKFDQMETVFDVLTESDFFEFHEDGQIENIDFDRWPLLRAVLEAGLSKHAFTLMGEPVTVSVTTTNNRHLRVKISGCAMGERGALVMPRGLTVIENKAFEKTGAAKVIINGECTVIRDRAFADSGIRMIRIPGSVTEIAGDVFDGCGKIIVIAEEGTDAAMFAEEKGFIRIEPST